VRRAQRKLPEVTGFLSFTPDGETSAEIPNCTRKTDITPLLNVEGKRFGRKQIPSVDAAVVFGESGPAKPGLRA
jgi:hypothetical protein